MPTALDYGSIRRLILKALSSDQWLYERLFLKGGNALTLIYKVSQRTSLDFDFSLETHFTDLELAAERLRRALVSSFEHTEYLLFDFTFRELPPNPPDDWWGGYSVEFKLIPHTLAGRLGHELAAMQRQSVNTDPNSDTKRFRIEISKHEHVRPAERHRIDDIPIQVYSPTLIVAEKLRAILQQHPDYPVIPVRKKRSRARDFYDIWIVCEHYSIRLDAHLELVAAVFDVKHVSLSLLCKLDDVRDLHASSWSDVEGSVASTLDEFDFYFEYVRAAANRLYALWIKDAPL